MNEKFCKDTSYHAGGLPVDQFYLNPRYADGYSNYCKKCQSRRSTASVYKARQIRRDAGLTVKPSKTECDVARANKEAADFESRSRARRIEEERIALELQKQDEPEIKEFSDRTFSGAIGALLYQGTEIKRSRKWGTW